MDAIITAGGIPRPEDPLYTYSHGDSKALIDVAGQPMIQWVLDAVGESKHVNNVIIIGLSARNTLTCKKPMYYLPNQGRMLSNIVAGVQKSLALNKKNQYVLIVSSDIPTVKSAMVDWLIETCQETEDDLYYGVCPRAVMEARFPESKRTWTHLKDMDVCGADMNISHVRNATEHLDMWESLIGSRKSPLKQAGIIGYGTLFKLLTRQLTLEEAVSRVSERIGFKGRAIVWPYAEPCMDVDKPHQLEMLREDLEYQQREAGQNNSSANRKSGTGSSKSGMGKPAAPKKSSGAKKVVAFEAAKTSTKTKAKPKAR